MKREFFTRTCITKGNHGSSNTRKTVKKPQLGEVTNLNLAYRKKENNDDKGTSYMSRLSSSIFDKMILPIKLYGSSFLIPKHFLLPV